VRRDLRDGGLSSGHGSPRVDGARHRHAIRRLQSRNARRATRCQRCSMTGG
jgi:hypothetical protein